MKYRDFEENCQLEFKWLGLGCHFIVDYFKEDRNWAWIRPNSKIKFYDSQISELRQFKI